MSNYILTTAGAVNYEFVRWEGPRPQFPKRQMMAFRKPGQDGITALNQGENGNQFQVTLTAIALDDAELQTLEGVYRTLISSVLQLTYEGVSWRTVYNVDYLVMDVTNAMAKRQAIICGPGYSYNNAWYLKSTWDLIPVYHVAE